MIFCRICFRYEAVLLRQRFDENRNVSEPTAVKSLVAKAEQELFEKQHYQPIKCERKHWLFSPVESLLSDLFLLAPVAFSPGGVAYGRELKSPDWVLDYWHPEEKAQYPEYFARREQRKKEYVEYWEKKFGKAEESHHHH